MAWYGQSMNQSINQHNQINQSNKINPIVWYGTVYDGALALSFVLWFMCCIAVAVGSHVRYMYERTSRPELRTSLKILPLVSPIDLASKAPLYSSYLFGIKAL